MSVATQQTPAPAHELSNETMPLPKLRANYGDDIDQSSVGWMLETPSDTPVHEMRRRFEENGYIHVKHLIPREDVLDVRQEYFEHLQPTGILQPGTSPREGIFNLGEDPIVHNGVGGSDLPDDVARVDKLTSAHSLPAYLRFVEHPNLRSFVQEFMGWKKDVMLTRTLLRHNVPNGFSTGIHYDKCFLRGGEAEFLTAWVPIGDCLPEGGGLMYLEHSDDIGKAVEEDFTKRAQSLTPEERISGFNRNMARDGQLSHNVEEFKKEYLNGKFGDPSTKRRWLVGNYEAGDVVFHNQYLIHGAVKNQDPKGRIRLGTDLRFYEEGAPLDTRWMQLWKPDDGL